jgi:hypothetical protein
MIYLFIYNFIFIVHLLSWIFNHVSDCFYNTDQRALGMSMRVERASLEQVHNLTHFHVATCIISYELVTLGHKFFESISTSVVKLKPTTAGI